MTTQPAAWAVAPDDLRQELPLMQQALRQSGFAALAGSLAPGPYGLTVTHLRLLEILEQAGALMLELEKRLHQRMAWDRRGGQGFDFASLGAEDYLFASLYGLYVAAEAAGARCRALGSGALEVRGAFSSSRVLALARLSGLPLVEGLLLDLQGFLEHHRDHPDPGRRLDTVEQVADCLSAYFQLLERGCAEVVADAAFEGHRRALEELPLEALGRRYRGFAALGPARGEDSEGLLPVQPEDVVGNQDYLKAGLRLARDVAGFDFQRGQNPKKINPVLFALGAPGCGKTVTAHAVGNYFLQYCRERGIPARFRVIRRTDWASSYQNASASRLIYIFKDQVAGFPGVVGVYWPDIDTAFAARSDPGLRSEERNILGASFGIFDGTLIPKNGQWFLMCDANYMNMDEATLSRITQDPYMIQGPTTASEYALLARKKLADLADLLPLDEEAWLEFGQRCLDYGFSGRNVENVCRKAATEIQDVEPPEEYYRADFEERRRILRGLSRPLSRERLLALADDYHRFEQEAQARAEQQRFRQRVEEIVFNLSAQKAALQAYGPE
ncbi:MAG TPA: AAA family ATPase [Candidatus Nitrosotenuis sp.]|jgi:hypothetical protein|nr:AAA family ATPase [Candidatus Nitrosotenuis sp.]